MGDIGGSKIPEKKALQNALIENSNAELTSISNKIDAIINYQLNLGMTLSKLTSMILILLGTSLLFMLISSFKYFQKGRYISANDYSKSVNSRKEKRKQIILYSGLLATVLSIATGLLSNYMWESFFR